MEKEPIYIDCECGTEAIQLHEIINDDIVDGERVVLFREYNFAIYKNQLYNAHPNFWQRIKYCWYHLITGKKHDDQIIIHEDQVKKIVDYLT